MTYTKHACLSTPHPHSKPDAGQSPSRTSRGPACGGAGGGAMPEKDMRPSGAPGRGSASATTRQPCPAPPTSHSVCSCCVCSCTSTCVRAPEAFLCQAPVSVRESGSLGEPCLRCFVRRCGRRGPLGALHKLHLHQAARELGLAAGASIWLQRLGHGGKRACCAGAVDRRQRAVRRCGCLGRLESV